MPLAGVRLAPSKKSILWLLVVAVVVAACTAPETATLPGSHDEAWPGFFPVEPATQQGASIGALYPIVFFIAVGVFILVEGLLLFIVFRFRRRPTDDTLPPQTHGSNLLEVIWTAIPAIIVTALFVMTVATLTEVETLDDSPAVEIDVTGFQWQWTFDYPDEGLSFTGRGQEGPVMGIPVNETVRIRLHAQDVIHSFYVPQFLYKKDVVPGRVNQFDVVVQEPGVYVGQCAEFCGLAHTDMYFTVQAMERPDYDAWLQEQQQNGGEEPPPDGTTVEIETPDSFTFIPDQLSAPADAPIIFSLNNTDPDAPHNVAIEDALDGEPWIGLPIAQAGETATYTAPALPAGTYEFFCSVHPTTMRGTLTVGNE